MLKIKLYFFPQDSVLQAQLLNMDIITCPVLNVFFNWYQTLVRDNEDML